MGGESGGGVTDQTGVWTGRGSPAMISPGEAASKVAYWTTWFRVQYFEVMGSAVSHLVLPLSTDRKCYRSNVSCLA